MTTRGPVTVETWRRAERSGEYLHVLLDGVDITTQCFFADDVLGVVAVYKRDENGRIQLDPETREILRETKFGKVEIVAESNNRFGTPDDKD
jgi:hypothetical protein